MHKILPRQVDTVIVGSGPSALITSFILHGNIPVYDLSSPHPDPLLDDKLQSTQNLLSLDVDYVTEHFGASRMSYSTQALQINVLLDTLVRPWGETDVTENKTCVRWKHDPSQSVPHIVVGETKRTGGQWVNNPVKASWDIGTLSYAGMLSLPGYSFADYYCHRYGKDLPFFLRPSRKDVADYFAIYPSKVGIEDAIFPNTTLSGIRRTRNGFYISSHDIYCRHLVLASGTFTKPVPPRLLLQSLPPFSSAEHCSNEGATLVIGSGFSAADVITSTPPAQKIIHVYKWAPTKSPSPLRACHQNAYPEYAGVYRKMKMAALSSSQPNKTRRPSARRASSSSPFDLSRNWDQSYEGLPNTQIVDVQVYPGGKPATVTFKDDQGNTFTRQVGSLAYVVGRRGSLGFLEPDLLREVCPEYDATMGVTGRDMRDAANEDLEVAPDIFITGSLTGDTLIRFAYGGCVYAAGAIMERNHSNKVGAESPLRSTWAHSSKNSSRSASGSRSGRTSGSGSPNVNHIRTMKGLDGHNIGLDFFK